MIAVKSPKVNYWAINGVDGARLDGKKPTLLKYREGNKIDIRKVKVEAAARRLAATSTTSNTPSASATLDDKAVPILDEKHKKALSRRS